MAEEQVIDPAELENLREMIGGDPAFLAEMIDAYIDDTSSQLAAMPPALAAGDADQLRRIAHSVKSTSANFGARRLTQICQELEAVTRSNAIGGASAYMAEAEAEFVKVRRALEAVRSLAQEP